MQENDVTNRQITDGAYTEDSMAMTVVLLDKQSRIHSLWLPSEKEGKYGFFDEKDFSIPLVITGKDNAWVATCQQGGVFVAENQVIGSAIELSNETLVEVVFGEDKYVLYVYHCIANDNVFLPFYFEPHTDITIGRKTTNDICYPNMRVSRDHAIFHWTEAGWEIKDNNSRNGVYLNGRLVQNDLLKPSDVIYIMGLYIIVGVGFFAINNANNRVQITSPKVRLIQKQGDVVFSDVPKSQTSVMYERQPRRKYQYIAPEIDIENPPMSVNANKIPLALRMGNSIISGGQNLLSGNYLGVITSLVLPGLTQGMNEKDRKEYEEKRKEVYSEYLQVKQQEIQKEKRKEEQELNKIYPNLVVTLNNTIKRNRLWERRKFDEDFLSVRLGSGDIPLLAKKKYMGRKLAMEQDLLQEQMYALAEEKTMLHEAPVMLSLRNDYIVGIHGTMKQKVELAKNMILNLVMTHSYDELKVVVMGDEADISELDFVRYLPHNWDNARTYRYLATSDSDARQLNKLFSDHIESLNLNQNKKAPDVKKQTAYVVFAFSQDLYQCMDIMKSIQECDSYLGFSILAFFEGVPKECSKIVSLGENSKLIDLYHPEDNDQVFTSDIAKEEKVQEGINTLLSTKINLEEQKSEIPGSVTFLEMYHAGRVEHLNPMKRWRENNPIKSLAAPIGVAADGKLFLLDLHEKKQGPHGLIAGGTGSGKSEFIITYILSMAVNYSPDEVAFVLIDYKGGGLADAFVDEKRGIHLPHVVGTITNLDGSAIQRSLTSLNSEIKRRQRMFKQAKSKLGGGTMDIYDYQKLYRNQKVSEPMPHLFIISDEFAELKKQQPEFMDELISIARIGRSLGVHLILATQKPTGVVNDQIWSNSKFRVCLRVAEKSDSMEMLKRPEAAEIKNVGRFYLQVGYNELFAQGQSGWCGAGYIPQDEIVVEADQSVRFIDEIGQTVVEAKPKKETKKAECKQIEAIVKYLSTISQREGITPKKLWKEPLSSKIELQELLEDYKTTSYSSMDAVIGMIDDPENQVQFPYTIDMYSFRNMFICGSSGSGKSTLIKTLLYSLSARYSPARLQYYIFDLSGGALAGFANAPHCGVYLGENSDADFYRLLKMMKDIVAERKQLFSENDVTTFDSYREVHELPLILVIIDGYTNITSIKNGHELYANLQDYLRDSASYGIRYIIAANHNNEIHSKTRQELDLKLALNAKDKFEATDILGVRCDISTPSLPGRGVCIWEGTPLEYQAALLDSGMTSQEATQKLKQRLRDLTEKWSDELCTRYLPMADSDETYAEFCKDFKSERIPLGYSLRDMKKVAIPLQQLHMMSMYFGNPFGRKPVIQNLLYAAQTNQMEVIVIKRASDSVFDLSGEQNASYGFTGKLTCWEPTEEKLGVLIDRIRSELIARNVYRDEYCEQHGIPNTDRKRILKAARYLRTKTTPILILFEGMGDLARLERTETLQAIEQTFQVIFGGTKGYNIYLLAAFYPEDKDIYHVPMVSSFNTEQLSLLFGGRFDKQFIIDPLSSEYRIQNRVKKEYDRFLFKYHETVYPMRMPCGELNSGFDDPDEAEII